MSLKQQLNDLHKYRTPLFLVFVFCMMATFSFLATKGVDHSSASSLSGFKPGNIISDAVMGNYHSMTVQQIQAFLTSKNACKNTSYSQYQQLKAQYPHLDWHFENGHFVCLSEEKFGDGEVIGKGQTAAEIIYQAAQDYHINPQVLLVLLEKEQSLVSDDYPNTRQYRSATGYGCPDTDVCSAKYYGFKNQVRNAAALFRDVLDHGYYAYPEKTKGVYVGYHPNSTCGRSEVYIENRATSALYRYTPYQPNGAAIKAGYGTGDSCSAYGNRNFYLFFTDWFGSTQTAVNGERIVIPDGTYGLVSKSAPTKSLDVAGVVNKNGTNVQIFDRKTSGSVQWVFKRDASTGYYTIMNQKTAKYLALSTATPNSGTNVIITDQNNDCRNKWKVYETPDRYLTFESVCSTGMILDNYNGRDQNGNNVQVWITHPQDTGKWSIYTGETVKSGIYNIATKADVKKLIDIQNASSANGANIQLGAANNSVTQKWQVKYDARTDNYTIINPATGKALDLNNASINLRTNIQLWPSNGTCAQQWKILKNADNTYTFISACSSRRAIDVADGSSANGANIQLWEANGTNAQKWTLQVVANDRPLADGTYVITAKSDPSKAIDVNNAASANGTNIQLWEANGTNAQKWKMTYDAKSGSYYVINPATGKALDLSNASTYLRANIQLWSTNYTCAQQWKITQNSDNTYTFISGCAANRALDLYNGYTYNRTNIQLWETNGTNAQKWNIKATS